MNIKLGFDHKTVAVDLLDQIVFARLKDMEEDLQKWGDNQEVLFACRVMLAYMEKPSD